MRILIVEDDCSLAQAVAVVLTQQHYVVDIAADGQEAWEFVNVCNYDLILLDIVLPKLDGISLCQQLRQQGYQMLILLLTAKDTKTDKVMGLDAGADDYVVKPFDFQELSARIRALLRRGNSSLPPVLEWGGLRLDPSSFEVTYDSQTLHLTAKEFSILELFLRNNQRVYSRSAIVDLLWGAEEDPPAANTIKSHIKSLRQKLKAAGANYDFIETVYGMGYRLKPSCQEIETEATQEQQQTLLAAVAQAREAFKAKVGSRIAVLEQVVDSYRQGILDSQMLQQAEQEAHKLVGSLGSFGFIEGSQLAEEIEDLLAGKAFISVSQCLRLDQLVMQLQQEFYLTPVEVVHSEARQNLLLIVSKDAEVVEPLVKEAATEGMAVKIVNHLGALDDAIAFSNPNAILLDLNVSDSTQDSLNFVKELSRRSPAIPTLVITDKNNFLERVEVARAGGCSFLQKSVSPQQILQAITQVIQPTQITGARIMVVDDEPKVLTDIQKHLAPWGVNLNTLKDSRRFWEIFLEFAPDLLILDVDMPDINGIDICQVVRNEPDFNSLPVLFLVDTFAADIVEQLFVVGADDCLSKPIVGSKLINRIFNHLKRT
ncbi:MULTISPECIES: response regulator [unclassified Tolypothrix]|uniref:response regulator n=1 Tax=unclassified Tolypothrix TaxID=2649714 RepID=UPI0005EAC0D4|nr:MULTISPECIES: response regulator [unclassified Tolypothrix]BAY92743.1 multi-component transcriptional regulator [Microchaete diplosiphon NIES-3275]EKF05850.1 response regulator [Tolypothrix sp. PCC 7601]MBE9081497.1 response regulator [Tolypothrix sp. LEGE 11397]UYD26666.1 response regulator [Tolypothrix sp. PCC 7712]UYD37475.1 response regulator [Tolypothrix sp. PCC 7601]